MGNAFAGSPTRKDKGGGSNKKGSKKTRPNAFAMAAGMGGGAPPRKEKNLLQKITGGAGSAVGGALNVIDLPRAIIMSGAREAGGDWSLEDFIGQIQRHEGVGEVVQGMNLPGGINTKRALGFIGDVGLDPLTYLSGGATIGAKGAAAGAKVGRLATKKGVARALIKEGDQPLANKALQRGLNALSPQEAATAGIRQGLSVGIGNSRAVIPGTSGITSAANKLTQPVRSQLVKAGVGGRVGKAAKFSGLDGARTLISQDADMMARHERRGLEQKWTTQYADAEKRLAAADKDTIRQALEGAVPANAEAMELRALIDGIKAEAEEVTGRTLPTIDNYLPHRWTAEARAAAPKKAGAVSGGGGLKTKQGAERHRSLKPGDPWMGTILERADLDELNSISERAGIGQLFIDDPLQLTRMYIKEMGAFVERGVREKMMGVVDTPMVTVPTKNAKKAAKKAASLEETMVMLDASIRANRGQAEGLMPALDEVVSKVTKLESGGRKAAKRADAAGARGARLSDEIAASPIKSSEEVADTILKEGGISYHPKSGSVPTDGFAVALKGAEETFPATNATEIAAAIDQYVAKHDWDDAAIHLGGWVSDGKVYLDRSVIVPDRAAPEKMGREHGQLAIFDVAGGKEIPLPKPVLDPDPVIASQLPSTEIVAAGKQLHAQLLDVKTRLADLDKEAKAALKRIDEGGEGRQLLQSDGALASQEGVLGRIKTLKAEEKRILEQARHLQAVSRIKTVKVMQPEQVAFDHAAAARDSVMAQAEDNSSKLALLQGQLTKRQAEEAAARTQADDLFRQAEELRVQGDTQMAEIAALEGLAIKAERDLLKGSDKLDGFRRMATNTKKVEDAHAMAMAGLREFSPGRSAEPWVAEMMTALDRELTPQNVGRLIKEYDKMTGMWRGMALLSPGYHSRNVLGAMFNNALAGMDFGRYRQYRIAAKEYRLAGNSADSIKDPLVREAFASAMSKGIVDGTDIADYGDMGRAAAEPTILSAKNAEKMRRSIGRDNHLFRANRNLAHRAEKNVRMPLYIDTYIKTGGDEIAAVDAVVRFHFDYEDLSRFERNVMRRAAGFYTWTRKNLPLQIEMMMTRPGKYARYSHLKRNLELGVPEEEDEPSYYKDLLAIRLPFSFSGGRAYLTPDLPFVGMSKTLDPSQLLSSMAPIPKVALEGSLDYSLFEQRSFNPKPKDVPTVWKTLLEVMAKGQFIPGMPKIWKGADGRMLMAESDANKIMSAIPTLAQARRLFPSDEKYQDRVWSTWISYTLGIGTRTLDKASKSGEQLRRKAADSEENAINKALGR